MKPISEKRDRKSNRHRTRLTLCTEKATVVASGSPEFALTRKSPLPLERGAFVRKIAAWRRNPA